MRLGVSLLFWLFVGDAYSAKILFFASRFGRSHVTFAGDIADVMAEAGHQVVMLILDMDPQLTMNGTKLGKTIVIPASGPILKFYEESTFHDEHWKMDSTGAMAQYHQLVQMADMFARTCALANVHNKILDSLKAFKFDLAVAEVFDACAFGLIERLEIPAHVATASSSLLEGAAAVFGVPRFPSYVPSTFSATTDVMNYGERVANLVSSRVVQMFHEMIVSGEQTVFRKAFGDHFIELNEKIAQSSFMLVNSNPLYDFPHPITSKIIPIGGFSVESPKPLSDRWSEVMRQRRKAVLVSFGSVAKSSSMPKEMKSVLLKSFANFPTVTFIWKYEKAENIAKDFNNVVVADWVPQNDLLNDPRLVAFITHGGMNSLHEAIRSGTPMLMLPLFGDQMHNAKMAERTGTTVVLDKATLFSESQFTHAISLILNDESFTQRAQQLSRMVKKQPVDAKQTIIRHLEFAAEFGSLPLMDNVGRKLPTFRYFLLDVFVPLAMLSALLFSLIVFLLYRLVLIAIARIKKLQEAAAKKPKTQ